eukprot:TRINITY_DN7585_c0_g1_i1.p1 TRINITY_DN7585_c0_g1~~TRINITY_DN7585_c0_g1_i1.p1  ORF type:complete len:313 (-),score=50.42 TRINITY_DN7585_c0_g1_i1:13-924(-)
MKRGGGGKDKSSSLSASSPLWALIPPEVYWEVVVQHCPNGVRDVGALQCVCKAWRGVFGAPTLWHKLLARDFHWQPPTPSSATAVATTPATTEDATTEAEEKTIYSRYLAYTRQWAVVKAHKIEPAVDLIQSRPLQRGAVHFVEISVCNEAVWKEDAELRFGVGCRLQVPSTLVDIFNKHQGTGLYASGQLTVGSKIDYTIPAVPVGSKIGMMIDLRSGSEGITYFVSQRSVLPKIDMSQLWAVSPNDDASSTPEQRARLDAGLGRTPEPRLCFMVPPDADLQLYVPSAHTKPASWVVEDSDN